MTRFQVLCAQQYEPGFSETAKAELDLLSAKRTRDDRVASGISLNPDTGRRIKGLQKRFDDLKRGL